MNSQKKNKSFSTINPANGKTLATYNYMTDKDVETIIQKSHQSFLEWRKTTFEDRAKIIKAIGAELQNQKSELSEMMTNEMGKLLKQSYQEVDLCFSICEISAQKAADILKNEERELSNGGRGIITYSPIGIIYGIQPWNYPCYQVIRYAISNLMAGNSVLLKHASNVTGSAKLLESIFKAAGLPDGLFSVFIISHEQSDKVLNHELVRGITLTGSSEAGEIIGKKAGQALKKSVLELGSNDAYIVLEDADIDLAVKTCVMGRIYNNGETCIAAKRFVVVESIYDKFRDGFVKAMENITIGDPKDKSSKMGPIAREDLRETLHQQVEKSVKHGAKILCGGQIPKGEGFYYPATVLENVIPGQPAYDDELFGPVASLIKAKDENDAMRIANDSRFGLGGGIFSKNEKHAIELAMTHFDTGMVFINKFGLAEPNMPFGGVKNSGFGREHGGFGMKEFVNVKSIMLPN
ncbi:succinate-semialdehyde dehydrogenase/glutarate-semialdehyde dehydrogenase [Winogradskyella epiphytica]|uniref:Succinate-semialdehyde dehydrogenase/glutarate-semialdehyde dehydrogenase n=1 Tax=Winogradskyella epiphytica TaxID=262005 RepID=A0A2V4WXB9_9FLAO|nr:NAD-dependent succinate-semialdehyde dehydrogenase [Winogradskyella epiphytica]PYE81652.1 succinate-semialdehyde dehydrogenase/glutarate-semialdehyde dehydrogenase [Winogradskyella epiphytica]GGW63619.1 aldehyde dehydrogenase [Winogradskyella epiphytica]